MLPEGPVLEARNSETPSWRGLEPVLVPSLLPSFFQVQSCVPSTGRLLMGTQLKLGSAGQFLHGWCEGGGGGVGRRLHLLPWQGAELIDVTRALSRSSSPEMASIWDSVSECYRQKLLLNKVGCFPCCPPDPAVSWPLPGL